LTPEQFAEWQSERPQWISQETAVLAACVKDISDFISYDIGPAIRAKRNGDAMWYAMTNSDGTSLLVIMCTPHAIFTETTIETDDIEYGIIIKPLQFLEHLQSAGVRRLTPDEMDNFISGLF
jgi:hypothetical protein